MLLTVDHLTVDYLGRNKSVRAVDDVSFTLEAGETLGVVGESGSGKSTLALAILRLIRPKEGKIVSGRIILNGEDLLLLSEDRMREVRGKRISMIFQDPFTALNPVMRIKEQMAEVFMAHRDFVGAGLRARPKSELTLGQAHGPDPAVLSDALERVQLEPTRVLASYPHQLSGGQRQRVMIAMALLPRPEIVLADEPTTALDVLVQKEILDLLFQLQKELKMGLLFISHNLGLVAQRTQRMVVMKEGALVEEGAPEAIFRKPKHPYTQTLLDALTHLC